MVAAVAGAGGLGAERTAREWSEELAKTYRALEGFRATYTATSPGKPPMSAMIVIIATMPSTIAKA